MTLRTAPKTSDDAPASPVPVVRRRRAADSPERVAQSIVRGIVARHYLPGQRIPEADLTRELQVSRSTVREALRILAARGVVELTPNRGAAIRRLSRKDAQDLVEVMEMLAGLGARLAARNIGIEDNRTRFEAVARMLRAPHPPRELGNVLAERLDFYNIMFGIAGNSELGRVLPSARANLFRTQFHQYLTASDLRAMIREYRAVADAVLEGDEDKAERQMRKHIQATAQRTIPRLADDARRAGAAR